MPTHDPSIERTQVRPTSDEPTADRTGSDTAAELDADRTGPYRPARPADTPVPGYEILGILGRGGMGVVYHAREVALSRPVALKLVLGADRKALIRFLAEAEAAAAIDHPNVVRLYGYGDAGGQPYMALEYLSGGTLGDLLGDANRPSAVDAVRLVRHIARGVAAAHALGIVHRDLKPGNVLLDADGNPKVADFGLARRGPSDLTQTGAVMGTPAYMAPEQAKGDSKFVGPTADVWALGVILYQCLTGGRPFRGVDTWDVLRKVIGDEPARPRDLDPTVPRDLELICLKCLAKAPHERYPTAAELADDLDRFAAGEPVALRPAGLAERAVKWARRKPTLAGLYAAGVAAALLLAFGGVVAILYRSESQARDQAEAEREKAELAKRGESVARGEADTRRAEVETLNGRLADQNALRNADLALRAAGEGDTLRALTLLKGVDPARRNWEWRHVARVAQPETRRFWSDGLIICNLAVSGDGKRVLASCEEGVRHWEIDTGQELTGYRGHKGVVREVALHADGRRAISAATDGSVDIWSVESGKRLGGFLLEKFDGSIRLAVSPDGKTLAAGHASGVITLWNLDANSILGEMTGHTEFICCLRFLPDGRLLSGGFDGSLRAWDAAARRELTRERLAGLRAPIRSLAVAPDGKSVWAGDESGRVHHFESTPGRPPTPVAEDGFVAHSDRLCTISFSAVGTRMLTGGMDRMARVWAVGRTGRVVTDRPLRVLNGHFNDVDDAAFLDPGGGRVLTAADSAVRLFDATRDCGVRTIAADPRPAAEPAAPLVDVSFDPTGKRVYGCDDERVYAWDVATGLAIPDWPRRDTTFRTQSQAFSPDGRLIAEGSPTGAVRVRPVAGGGGSTWATGSKPDPVLGCAFAADSGTLATLGRQGDLRLWDIATRRCLWTAAAHKPGQARHVAFSPDGGTLATCGTDRHIKLWGAADGTLLRTLTGHTHEVNQVAFSPDGTRLASASSDNTARVWDVPTGREVLSMRTHSHYVFGVAFSPDGTRLADAAGDGIVTLYDARTGQEAIRLRGHKGEVLRVAFSPAGDRLVSCGEDGTIRLWDAPLDAAVDLPAKAERSYDPTGNTNDSR